VRVRQIHFVVGLALLACSSAPQNPEQVGSASGSGGVVGSGGAVNPQAQAGGGSGGGASLPHSGGSGGAAGGVAAPPRSGTGGASAAHDGSGGAGTQTMKPGDAGTDAATTAGGAAGAPACDAAHAASSCGCSMPDAHAFGCSFAWGTNDPSGSLASYNYLQFISKWVGYEVQQDGSVPSCDGCTWLSQQIAPTALVPVYYAYFIGYFGHVKGFMDGNQNPNGPNLTTDGAQLIRDQRQAIIDMYSGYAKRSYAVWTSKPLVWLLEGDFVQYAADSQKNKLSYMELGQLAADIACAIKSNMPNALVAIDHSTWNSDQVTNDFWNAMKAVSYDMVWTTGVANNNGFFDASTKPDAYNHATATYSYVHGLTGRPILVDTSFGLSQMGDSWSNADAATLNARIADGVIAANVTMPPGGYSSAIAALSPQLHPICQ
jgi:hypothetical protein